MGVIIVVEKATYSTVLLTSISRISRRQRTRIYPHVQLQNIILRVQDSPWSR